jgi:hypothetical protein
MSTLNLFTRIQNDTSNVGKFRTSLLVGACDLGEVAATSPPIFQDSNGVSSNSISTLTKLNLNLRKHLATDNPVEQLVAVNGLKVNVGVSLQ